MYLFHWTYDDLLNLPEAVYDAALQLARDELLAAPRTTDDDPDAAS